MVKLRYWVIYLSLVLGIILMILPLPESVQIYRPHWVALILIYWSMAMPKRVGLWTAFLTGILVDVSQGTLLGQHAMGLVIVIFINQNSYQRIRVLSLLQQALYVFLLLFINQIIMVLIEGYLGRPTPFRALLGAPVIGMFIWPWVFVTLRDLRRKAHLS